MKKAIVLILLAAQFLFCFGVCAETAESEIDRFAADIDDDLCIRLL